VLSGSNDLSKRCRIFCSIQLPKTTQFKNGHVANIERLWPWVALHAIIPSSRTCHLLYQRQKSLLSKSTLPNTAHSHQNPKNIYIKIDFLKNILSTILILKFKLNKLKIYLRISLGIWNICFSYLFIFNQ